MDSKKTNIRIRKTNYSSNDLEGIYESHLKCFEKGDVWYKSIIKQSLNNSWIIEKSDKPCTIIGVLLQGIAIPSEEIDDTNFKQITPSGDIIIKNKLHLEELPTILMLCIDPEFRNKGLAKKLIEIHFNEYKNELIYLITRKSNPAYNLYLKMGYEHVANIKDKYFFPTEDGYFLIKNN